MAGLSDEEYADLKCRLSDLADHFEHQRDGAKAAAEHYPSTAPRTLGEADAYEDAAEHIRLLLSSYAKD